MRFCRGCTSLLAQRLLHGRGWPTGTTTLTAGSPAIPSLTDQNGMCLRAASWRCFFSGEGASSRQRRPAAAYGRRMDHCVRPLPRTSQTPQPSGILMHLLAGSAIQRPAMWASLARKSNCARTPGCLGHLCGHTPVLQTGVGTLSLTGLEHRLRRPSRARRLAGPAPEPLTRRQRPERGVTAGP